MQISIPPVIPPITIPRTVFSDGPYCCHIDNGLENMKLLGEVGRSWARRGREIGSLGSWNRLNSAHFSWRRGSMECEDPANSMGFWRRREIRRREGAHGFSQIWRHNKNGRKTRRRRWKRRRRRRRREDAGWRTRQGAEAGSTRQQTETGKMQAGERGNHEKWTRDGDETEGRRRFVAVSTNKQINLFGTEHGVTSQRRGTRTTRAVTLTQRTSYNFRTWETR